MTAARFVGSAMPIGMRVPGTFLLGAAMNSLSDFSSHVSLDALSAAE